MSDKWLANTFQTYRESGLSIYTEIYDAWCDGLVIPIVGLEGNFRVESTDKGREWIKSTPVDVFFNSRVSS